MAGTIDPATVRTTTFSAIALRKLRLITGLILFAYVGTHLIDHSLGNISIGAMQADLAVQRWIWQGRLGTDILYAALTGHYLLGLWAFYERRHFGRSRGEIWQAVLGLAIPFLLINHIIVTRVALAQFGILKGYPQELQSFFVARPDLGLLQLAILVVAWVHGCLGVYFWLRLKRVFARLATPLFTAAVMLPTLALLGVFQSGREVVGLSRDPSWRAANLAAWQAGTAAENHALLLERNLALLAMAALLGIVALARLARTRREASGGNVRITYPDGRVARVPLGFSVLEASRIEGIPHASVCGGRARCSTCRVRIVAGAAPPAGLGEQLVLDRVGAPPEVRLACQLRPTSDITVVPLLPPGVGLWHDQPKPGEERFIVVLVADMRDSASLAERLLPFDAVFVIDRFVAALSTAVADAGGIANQFTGDGILAIFGLDVTPEHACRQALAAVDLIVERLAALNAVLAAEQALPIRFGLGVHGSNVIVGEVTMAGSRIFTTLGEAANVATRLEGLCKEYDCQAVMSDEVCRLGGSALAPQPVVQVTIGGMRPLQVRLARSAAPSPVRGITR